MTLSGVWRRFLDMVSPSEAARKKLSKGKYFLGLVYFENRDVIEMMTLSSYLASLGLQTIFENFWGRRAGPSSDRMTEAMERGMK
jgi:hypothetical protein